MEREERGERGGHKVKGNFLLSVMEGEIAYLRVLWVQTTEKTEQFQEKESTRLCNVCNGEPPWGLVSTEGSRGLAYQCFALREAAILGM